MFIATLVYQRLLYIEIIEMDYAVVDLSWIICHVFERNSGFEGEAWIVWLGDSF